MKIKYLILFLILILISNLGLGCIGSELKEKVITIKPISRTISVQYVVTGHRDIEEGYSKVSVTYNNAQGGTEQINGLVLRKSINDTLRDLNKPINFGDSEAFRGEIIASYDHFPKDEFLYISAQNQNDSGEVYVNIIVDGEIWKHGFCRGEYCITDANGYYDK